MPRRLTLAKQVNVDGAALALNPMVISDAQLEQLSRTELIALVRALYTHITSLETRVAELEAKLPPGAPPVTSRNSSQPPSRDQKPNLIASKGAKRIGAKPGHPVATRPLVEKPDRVLAKLGERVLAGFINNRDLVRISFGGFLKKKDTRIDHWPRF